MYWSQTFAGVRGFQDDVEKAVSVAIGETLLADVIIESVLLLADNAILHTLSGEPGGEFQVQITRGIDYWLIRVDDAGTIASQPCRRPREPDAVHGLDRLQEIATHWGVIGNDNGRAVFAEFEHQPPKR